MKMVTIARITGMLPNGTVTGVRVLGTGLVPDSYQFGLKQWPTIVASPVTGETVTVYEPELHAEGSDVSAWVHPNGQDHSSQLLDVR